MSTRGAEYRKTDLQIHSPRDANWSGPRPEDALPRGATDEDCKRTRDGYCKQFIEKCVEKGLKAVAVTDHHEGVYMYEALIVLAGMRAADPTLDFWLFPGMELTCRDSCQALIIFDESLPQNLFEKARAKLGLPTDVRPAASRGIQVDLLNDNIEDLQGLLDEDSELVGRFIIFPHVKPGGFDERKTQRVLKKLRDLRLLERQGKGPATSYKVLRP